MKKTDYYEICKQKLKYLNYSDRTIKSYLYYIQQFLENTKVFPTRLKSNDFQLYLDNYEFASSFYDLSDNFESTSPKIVSEFRPKECISRYNSEIQKSILSKTGIKYQKTFIITQPKIENFIEIFNESNEFIKSYIGKNISLINLDILTERHGTQYLICRIGNPKLDDLFKHLN